MIAALAVAALADPASARPPAQAVPSPGPAAEPSEPSTPAVTARAAIVLEAETGRVLFQKDAHARLPPASLTKMVTAIVALERAEPDQPVVATPLSMAEPSVIGLDPGDRLPLREALFGLLLNSGNDAALAIAESVGRGSIDGYVGWMNRLVRSLGLTNTTLANPHGLDEGEHFSSAYDMAIAGRVLLRAPLLRQIVAERRRDYDAPPLWAFRNSNRFLTAYPGADGIKTGYEIRAGRCLAASATRDGRQLISVVLNSEDPVADSAALMDYAFARPREASAPPASAGAPRNGRTERLLRAAVAVSVPRSERSILRSLLRPDLPSLDRDPTLLAGPASAFERLRAAGRGGG